MLTERFHLEGGDRLGLGLAPVFEEAQMFGDEQAGSAVPNPRAVDPYRSVGRLLAARNVFFLKNLPASLPYIHL